MSISFDTLNLLDASQFDGNLILMNAVANARTPPTALSSDKRVQNFLISFKFCAESVSHVRWRLGAWRSFEWQPRRGQRAAGQKNELLANRFLSSRIFMHFFRVHELQMIFDIY